MLFSMRFPQTTYFSNLGKILGYSNTHEYSWDETYGEDGDEVTVTIEGSSTNYNDANWNWLGSSWSDVYGEGYNSNVVVGGERIETGSFTSCNQWCAGRRGRRT